jgi:hypothetical protein
VNSFFSKNNRSHDRIRRNTRVTPATREAESKSSCLVLPDVLNLVWYFAEFSFLQEEGLFSFLCFLSIKRLPYMFYETPAAVIQFLITLSINLNQQRRKTRPTTHINYLPSFIFALNSSKTFCVINFAFSPTHLSYTCHH